MNVPATIRDAALAEYLSLFFDVRTDRSFTCDACHRVQQNTWWIELPKKVRRSWSINDAIAPLRGEYTHQSWCIRCCRTLNDITLVAVVAARLTHDRNEIPF